jgi:hypothetical protein
MPAPAKVTENQWGEFFCFSSEKQRAYPRLTPWAIAEDCSAAKNNFENTP